MYPINCKYLLTYDHNIENPNFEYINWCEILNLFTDFPQVIDYANVAILGLYF